MENIIRDDHGDERPVAQLIKSVHAGGGVDLFKAAHQPGMSLSYHRTSPAEAAPDPNLVSISDELLDEIIRDGRDHLPPCPNADDYADMRVTLAAKAERDKRLLRARQGKTYTAEQPGIVKE